MSIEAGLDMQALDVTTAPWEDLKREVLADDPDAVAPLFIGDSHREGIFLCGGCGGCVCSGSVSPCTFCGVYCDSNCGEAENG
jgi:hypothetical protein